MIHIRSVAVLGAGVMGAQIAAHVANAGLPALLLDVSLEAAERGLQRARTLKPDPFFTPDTWKLISLGALDRHLDRLKDADWTIEAVVERIDVKRDLLARVDLARRPGSIVSSNTSGIPIAALADGRSPDFKQHWLGTHFFNPPRYLHLLEVIPTADTRPEVADAVITFADRHLGKGAVVALDSPGFIANHLALYGVLRILGQVASGELTIEEADAVTGPAIGRPKSATFRTLDIAGLDIFAQVVRDLHDRTTNDLTRASFVLPRFVEQMLERGLTGEKAGHGFYKRIREADGTTTILVLDPDTLEYREQRPVRIPSIEPAGAPPAAADRIRAVFNAEDRAGRFLRDTLAPTLVYAAHMTPSIARSADDADKALRWGFGWELGPFEIAEAIGIQAVHSATENAAPELIAAGAPSWRDARQSAPAPGDLLILRAAKDRARVVKTNAGGSLVDLGDGVLCVEFHSKMNTIGRDTIDMLRAGEREAARNFAALVVGNEGSHFTAGANLMLALVEAQDGNWDEIDATLRAFQQAVLALRYSVVPVIVAPAGLSLGGGCEITLHADRVQAAAECYLGLVEVGVGLVPAGGGTKEMLARATEHVLPGSAEYLPAVQRAFETIAFGKTSTSGPDARRLGYLRDVDGITMNLERLLSDAKVRALQRLHDGYLPPQRRSAIPVGGDAVAAPLKLGVHLAWRAGRISDHDAVIGRALATIMAGGDLPHPAQVSEQHILDLEREAFLHLLGERKTQERIRHTLKTGKPLRN